VEGCWFCVDGRVGRGVCFVTYAWLAFVGSILMCACFW